MKPLDFGADGVTGSVNADGKISALNFYHPQHGYVTLTSADPFPEGDRYNPPAVRAYRASLAQLSGFGLHFDAPIRAQKSTLLDGAIPQVELTFDGGIATLTTYACPQGAVQLIMVAGGLAPRWRGKLSLQRCAYTQLTEGGPLPMPPLHMAISCRDGLLVIHNPELGAAVAVAGLSVACDEQHTEQPSDFTSRIPSGEPVTLAYGVGLTVDEAMANARWLLANAALEDAAAHWQAVLRGLPDDPLMIRRGIVYGLMMAVPVGEGVCLLTDHMLLPLSWNRDAYFVARALLSAGQHDVVRRHLLWTFESAERIDGMWARCYLANGHVKDAAFQLDQQLYPLLELAEYVLETGDQEMLTRLRSNIQSVLMALDARRKADTLLFPTDETPADDPIALPYHLSSHILMWRTLSKLAALGAAGDWVNRIDGLYETIQQSFITENEGQRIYAYATDMIGRFHFYHDANDFPLALAPTWGFIPAHDSVWQATVDFAFSSANGGMYAGRLGSIHTPAPWPLGDVQELIIARALDDAPREQRVWAHLCAASQWDGALPEACDAETGAVVSRHWFAWPNAALACAELGAFER